MVDTASMQQEPHWYDETIESWRDRLTGDPGYVGRHHESGFDAGFAFDSNVHRCVVAASRADRAVAVLAATDHLPASRLLYRELLRAGALSSSVRTVA